MSRQKQVLPMIIADDRLALEGHIERPVTAADDIFDTQVFDILRRQADGRRGLLRPAGTQAILLPGRRTGTPPIQFPLGDATRLAPEVQEGRRIARQKSLPRPLQIRTGVRRVDMIADAQAVGPHAAAEPARTSTGEPAVAAVWEAGVWMCQSDVMFIMKILIVSGTSNVRAAICGRASCRREGA